MSTTQSTQRRLIILFYKALNFPFIINNYSNQFVKTTEIRNKKVAM